MKNILIINGHQQYRSAEGKLNNTLVENMIRVLSPYNNVKTTVIQNGYHAEEEQQKFLWADVVIYQTPIYWFSVPGLLKTYMDEVYAYGTFFTGADQYGTGGLLTDKTYMLSTTWNAPASAFEDKTQFFEGNSLDEALQHLHRIHKFLGMKPLKSFSCYDVVKNPNIKQYIANLEQHLKEALTNEPVAK
ncbi:NAD(P)H-dependent oxidoreductase [Paenibacillus alvei]|uniref:NAD(P)H-dependent oxidoreductase n=1 Tax=Paenibacillus alvei TaxID=44250 RepID=A0AAP7DK51_PAEAL|nr:NAD(P)H-dependent oxidoreductase [Paenibacillus alvei]MBG9732944.1 flavodoxin [Paenibacillus alvei]MBG9743925.1 flavodoxin [Paenibacillus alvei]MCY9582987.1 NAD(P)H-dependent oxidoreductase [Paenibacillus alvei]MCY9588223.1 NAD(P)H-dependent oxidoreductase [Paenibacillus alvei]NEZ41315.1 flavodoxin family protein [Paenibacillus alvei]